MTDDNPNSTTITIDGHVVPKARPNFDSRSKQAYHKRDYALWLDDAAWQVKAQRHGRKHTGPIKVLIVVNGSRASVRITDVDGQRPKGVRGDIDNIGGSILDALQKGGIIGNDSQTHHLEAWFWDDDLELAQSEMAE